VVGDDSSVEFAANSTAASATISAGVSSAISFDDSSRGSTAQIDLFRIFPLTSILDISGHNAPGVTIGSLYGDEGHDLD
jgi:hypothetical protein